jgi:hypothetical protein
MILAIMQNLSFWSPIVSPEHGSKACHSPPHPPEDVAAGQA